jgi:hypothetical protein
MGAIAFVWFSRPQGGNLTNRKHTRTLAAVAPAKADLDSGAISGGMKRNEEMRKKRRRSM